MASVVYNLLDPVPFGFFIAALIFDAVYARSGEVLWMKSAAWLIALGLLIAVPPRLINLVRVWFPGGKPRHLAEVIAFWLNLVGIAAAIVNAFVHSRDAYGVIPQGLWLSILTVVLFVSANVILTPRQSNEKA